MISIKKRNSTIFNIGQKKIIFLMLNREEISLPMLEEEPKKDRR